MTDQEPEDPRALADSLVDSLLEEHLGGKAPPDRAAAIAQAARSARPAGERTRGTADFATDFASVWRDTQRSERRQRPPVAAAAVLLVGTAVVVGTVMMQRSTERTAEHTAEHTAQHTAQHTATAPQGQGPDSKPRPNTASAFFPLQVGSVWEYRDVTGEQQTAHTVRACVAVPVGDDLVVQLADCSDGDVAFTFWSSDARGIRRHGRVGMRDDPLFGAAGPVCIELPSPIGAQATWPIERVSERSRPAAGALGGFGAGAGGGRPNADGRPGGGVPGAGAGGPGGGGMSGRAGARPPVTGPQRGTATLLGLDEELRLGEQTWRCAHVRVAIDGAQGQLVEESWYARGVGLVRRTSSGNGPETVRELVRYTPAQPLPARDTLLAASLGDAAKTARWIELPANEETAWTLRAQFAVVQVGDTTHAYALVDDHLIQFAALNVPSYQVLARAEDFAARMHGLFPQRVTHGLCRLAVRLRAAELGLEVLAGERSSGIRVGADACTGQVRMKVRGADRTLQTFGANVELRGTEPTDVHIDVAR